MRVTVGKTRLELKEGDITREETDAVVNAANSSLMGGGGVDGAIHRAGGPRILDECKRIRERSGRLPAGGAVITTGGNLKARFVIHTVGPVYSGGNRGEAEKLSACYTNSLAFATEKGLKSIAFPSISTGAYRYPVGLAAAVALTAVKAFLESRSTSLETVRFVLFSPADFAAYKAALEKVL